MGYKIRPLRPMEYPVLEEFLYYAIFVLPGEQPPPREILRKPELQVYLEGFGEGPADHALAAEENGEIVGAVWVRIMKDYGHVDDDTPSFAISVLPGRRGCGIGSALLEAMLGLLRQRGFRQASLAAQKENYAVEMYRKAGFRTIRETGEEFIMICRLQS